MGTFGVEKIKATRYKFNVFKIIFYNHLTRNGYMYPKYKPQNCSKLYKKFHLTVFKALRQTMKKLGLINQTHGFFVVVQVENKI